MKPQPGSTLPSSSAKGHADDVYVLLQWASGKPQTDSPYFQHLQLLGKLKPTENS